MITVGQKIRYLGVSYIVKDISDLSVTIKRETGGAVELCVAVGSNRYNAIFPDEAKKVAKKFAVDTEQEVKIKDKDTAIYKKWGGVDYINIDEDGKVYKFLCKYYKGAESDWESNEAVVESMTKELREDKTGVIRFIITSWANRNNAFKFDAYEVAEILYHKHPLRPQIYSDRLLEFYLTSLQDDGDPTDAEYNILSSLIPQDDGLSLLQCFCGFTGWADWEINDCILKPKKLLEILKSVPANTPEELN